MICLLICADQNLNNDYILISHMDFCNSIVKLQAFLIEIELYRS